MIKACKEFLRKIEWNYEFNWKHNILHFYKIAKEEIEKAEVKKLDLGWINRIKLENWKFECLGIFISALINFLPAQQFKLTLTQKLSLIGFLEKKKKVWIKGSLGNHIGCFLRGGELIVEGDVGDYLGTFMSSGRLVVLGNCGEWVGNQMEGGLIKVKGKIGSLSSWIYGGRIKVNGKTLVWKLKFVEKLKNLLWKR